MRKAGDARGSQHVRNLAAAAGHESRRARKLAWLARGVAAAGRVQDGASAMERIQDDASFVLQDQRLL